MISFYLLNKIPRWDDTFHVITLFVQRFCNHLMLTSLGMRMVGMFINEIEAHFPQIDYHTKKICGLCYLQYSICCVYPELSIDCIKVGRSHFLGPLQFWNCNKPIVILWAGEKSKCAHHTICKGTWTDSRTW